MLRIFCIFFVFGMKFSGLEVFQFESDIKFDIYFILMGSEKSSKVNIMLKIFCVGYVSDEDVIGFQSIMVFDSSFEDEEGLGQESFFGGKFNDVSFLFDVDG